MSDYDSDNEDINYTAVPRGYLYEPEYTDAEIRQMELERAEREERAREEAQDEAGATAGVARDRVTDKWWCTCSKCQLMPTEVESYCCHEWDLIMPQMQNLSIDEEASAPVSVCITNHEDFPAILNAGVLQIFFNIPKPNWRRNPRPAGPDGLLSSEQYRLVAYRIVIEWALKGEKLGPGNRRVLPSCVVDLIRGTYPSPNGQYAGFKESEDALAFF
ncbi:hypothetical protein N1851_018310 [Merluccius polli]|uniref:P2X purinoreceptor 7 intracellular domain-containing protein n=1 Tax=Merluccius polli TaxID=89951 RepID=A0AA47NYH4_MERPO|nr:hypothetical protein N1851_018310 [Merluccius polli]